MSGFFSGNQLKEEEKYLKNVQYAVDNVGQQCIRCVFNGPLM